MLWPVSLADRLLQFLGLITNFVVWPHRAGSSTEHAVRGFAEVMACLPQSPGPLVDESFLPQAPVAGKPADNVFEFAD
jgi:hypothetical protein